MTQHYFYRRHSSGARHVLAAQGGEGACKQVSLCGQARLCRARQGVVPSHQLGLDLTNRSRSQNTVRTTTTTASHAPRLPAHAAVCAFPTELRRYQPPRVTQTSLLPLQLP